MDNNNSNTQWSGKKFSEVETLITTSLAGKLETPTGGTTGQVIKKAATGGGAWADLGAMISGYYYNGGMYEDVTHVIPVVPETGILYVDKTEGASNSFWVWTGTVYERAGGIPDVPAGPTGMTYVRKHGTWEQVNWNREVVNVRVVGADTELGLDAVNVTFTWGTEQRTIQTAQGGYCSLAIDRGIEYTVSVQSPTGYSTLPTRTYTAEYFSRQVDFILHPGASAPVNLTVNYTIDGVAATSGTINGKLIFIGLTGSSHPSMASPVVSGTATFVVSSGAWVESIASPAMTNKDTPASPARFQVNGDTSVTLDYVTNLPPGIYLSKCNSTGTELTDVDETAIVLSAGEKLVAFHVRTSGLETAGLDYYVPISVINGTWQTPALEAGVRNVSVELSAGEGETTYTRDQGQWMSRAGDSLTGLGNDGKVNTTIMAQFAQNNNLTTIATRVLEMTYMATPMTGFIPTETQMAPIFSNKSRLESLLGIAGLTNATFKEYEQIWWSSSQYDGLHAMYWYGSGWYKLSKDCSRGVFPAFAI